MLLFRSLFANADQLAQDKLRVVIILDIDAICYSDTIVKELISKVWNTAARTSSCDSRDLLDVKVLNVIGYYISAHMEQ